jgi:tetratricopeptide (TPR) repeat protein
LILGLLGFITGLLYANSLENGFLLWDDQSYIVENTLIQKLSWSHIYQIFSSILVGNYTPVTILSYAWDYAIWKLDPRGYHLTNLLLYLIDTFLVYILASKIFQRPPFALLSTLIFLVHPLHVESVTWLSARKDVLSLAFFLISFLLFIQYLEQMPAKSQGPKNQTKFSLRLKYLGALLSLILALLSKATTLVLPLVLVLYEVCKNGLESHPRMIRLRFRIYLPFFLISALLTYVHIKVSQVAGVIQEYHGGSFYLTLLTVPKVLWHYLQHFFFPVNLSVWYEIPIATSILELSTLLPLFTLLIILGLTMKSYTLSKRVFFALSWFFITLLPVSNLISTSTLVADRYLFIPSLGLSILLGIALENLFYFFDPFKIPFHNRLFSPDFPRTLALLGSIFLLLFYSILTVERNTVWFNNYTLWSDALEKSPDSYLVHHNLGTAYFQAGYLEAAKKEYEEALRIKPTALGTRYNLGILYAKKDQVDLAEAEFQKILELSPWHAEAHYNLGLLYDRQKRWDEAISAYQSALRFRPDYVEAHNNLGVLYYRKGLLDQAIEEFNQALKLKPDYVKSQNNLRLAYSRKNPSHPSNGSEGTPQP